MIHQVFVSFKRNVADVMPAEFGRAVTMAESRFLAKTISTLYVRSSGMGISGPIGRLVSPDRNTPFVLLQQSRPRPPVGMPQAVSQFVVQTDQLCVSHLDEQASVAIIPFSRRSFTLASPLIVCLCDRHLLPASKPICQQSLFYLSA